MTYEEIQSKIKELGVSLSSVKKELKILPETLGEGEELQNLISGALSGTNTGLLVITNKRLFFLDKKIIGGVEIEEFGYDKISSISHSKGMLTGKIKIHVSGNDADIHTHDKKHTPKVVETIKENMENLKQSNQAPTPTNDNSVINELKELNNLKDAGILTDEEFQAQKTKILNR
jgi:hypothetical protein